MKLGYVNVPVIANVYVAKGLALKAGVQFGFMTSAKTDIDVTLPVVGKYNIVDNGDIKDYMNTTDISIPMGISYEYNNFVLDARYNLGLTKIGKDNKDVSNIANTLGVKYDDTKNSVFQITLGYKFDL